MEVGQKFKRVSIEDRKNGGELGKIVTILDIRNESISLLACNGDKLLMGKNYFIEHFRAVIESKKPDIEPIRLMKDMNNETKVIHVIDKILNDRLALRAGARLRILKYLLNKEEENRS